MTVARTPATAISLTLATAPRQEHVKSRKDPVASERVEAEEHIHDSSALLHALIASSAFNHDNSAWIHRLISRRAVNMSTG
jgi:hypothetical protein